MMSQIYRAQQKVQKLTQRHSQMRIKQILEALDADGELNEATDKPKKGKSLKKKRSQKT